tara:strand:+ start:135 stop:578 length:444 start_codon:yes stop_codon:yes gene_type:complete
MRGLLFGVLGFFLPFILNQPLNQLPQILTTYYVFTPNQETVATITSASIERNALRKSRTRAAIEYQYVVDGLRYRNNLVRFKTPRFEVQQTLDRYTVGSKHVVRFNRLVPRFSVLEMSTLGGRVWLLLGFCVLIGLMIGSFKRYRLI